MSSKITFHNRIGYGTMDLTLHTNPISKEQAFEILKVAIDNGVDLFNAGEFYGSNPKEANLILLQDFFQKYPELRSKVKISVKGGVTDTLAPDSSEANIDKSITNILKYIEFIDVFECARVDPHVPIEDAMRFIKKYIDAGKVGGVSLSEASAKSIRAAATVLPISFVEVEFSMWCRHILSDGVYDACQELDIPILAYSPLGKGFLTGTLKDFEKQKAGNGVRTAIFQRFNDKDIFEHNLKLVEKVEAFAAEKKVSPAQLALAWILKFKGIVPIPGTTKPSRLLENLASVKVDLTDAEFKEINEFLDSFEVKGLRYNEHAEKHLML